MSLFSKSFDALEELDLQSLIADQVLKGKHWITRKNFLVAATMIGRSICMMCLLLQMLPEDSLFSV